MKYLIITLILAFGLISCKDEVNELENDIIINTKWVTRDEVKDFQLGGNNLRYLKFTSNEDVIYQTERNGDITSVTIGTYQIDYPTVKIDFNGEVFTYEFGFNDAELISKELQHLDGEWLTYFRTEY